MAGLPKQWTGRVFGTNTGNVFCQLDGPPTALKASLRIMDDRFGLAIYEGEGRYDGSNLRLSLTPIQADAPVSVKPIEIRGGLGQQGAITGNWVSELGTAGTFVLYPQDSAVEMTANAANEVLHTAERDLGAVRLYGPDFKLLVDAIRGDLRSSPVYVTFRERNTQRTLQVEQFLVEAEHLPPLHSLRLTANERETERINKVVEVSLDAELGNKVFVQGAQEAWARGKAEHLKSILERTQPPTLTVIKNHGLNINAVLLLLGIAALPELSFSKRLVFLVALIGVAATIAFFHKALISGTIIYLNEDRPTFWKRYAAPFTSAVIAAIAGALGAVIFGALSGNLVTALHGIWSYFAVPVGG